MEHKVSIHAPTWDATMKTIYRTRTERFQSTHPHGMRRLTINGHFRTLRFQSTHPHGMRLKLSDVTTLVNVSIHVPTWDATVLRFGFRFVTLFQSTHPHGMRLIRRGVISIFSLVSIHAPTWDATHCPWRSAHPRCVSIHAPTWDATLRRQHLH